MIGGMSRAMEKFRCDVGEIARQAKELGEDDPRRIIHSLKVGLAITIVSLFYYFDPLFDGFGISAMWAVITVVVVLEFSVGATLGRGVNRGIATCVAGALGVGAHRLASLAGEKCEPIFLGLFVFITAAIATFIRFFPKMKARYDYGMLVFILTFCLISVSGYRDDEIIEMAHKRLSTILIGGAVALIVCVCICPVWAGNELHNQLANNLEKLACFLEGFGAVYFSAESTESEDKKASLQGYKSFLNSKSTEEALANFARWEPRHRRFRYRHPWEQYLKIGSLARQCAYTIEALNNHLNSDIQTPKEVLARIQEPCMKISSECSFALKELALAIRGMTQPSIADNHIGNAKIAAKNLKSLLKTGLWQDVDILDIVPPATVASLLIDVVSNAEKIGKSVHELASLARFQSESSTQRSEEPKLTRQRKIQRSRSGFEGPHHVITMEEGSSSPMLRETSSSHSLTTSGGE